MRKIGVVVVMMVCALAFFAHGQANPAPPAQDMKEGMEAMFGAMAPVMAKMTEMMLEGTLRIAEKPETAARVAAFKKNLYDQLQKQGFTKDEAFTIMVNTSVPGVPAGMK